MFLILLDFVIFIIFHYGTTHYVELVVYESYKLI